MSYFESDIVKKEFEDLFKLEDELISKMMSSKLDTKEEIAELRELITKQKIVYTRLSLSDDPEAKKYKKNVAGRKIKRNSGELNNIYILFFIKEL